MKSTNKQIITVKKTVNQDKTQVSKKPISIRIEETHIEQAKKIARQLGIGYQTLFRSWIIERLNQYNRE